MDMTVRSKFSKQMIYPPNLVFKLPAFLLFIEEM